MLDIKPGLQNTKSVLFMPQTEYISRKIFWIIWCCSDELYKIQIFKSFQTLKCSNIKKKMSAKHSTFVSPSFCTKTKKKMILKKMISWKFWWVSTGFFLLRNVQCFVYKEITYMKTSFRVKFKRTRDFCLVLKVWLEHSYFLPEQYP